MDDHRQKLANKSYSNLISDGFKLFHQNYTKLILPMALFYIIGIILEALVLLILGEIFLKVNPRFYSFYIVFPLVISLIFLLLLIKSGMVAIAMSSVNIYLYKKYLGEDINFSMEFKKIFNKNILLIIISSPLFFSLFYYLYLFLTIASVLIFFFFNSPYLLGFGISFLFLIFLILNIIFVCFFLFFLFTNNMREMKKPVREAREIARGSFWKIFGIYFITFLIIQILSFIYNMIMFSILGLRLEIFTENYGTIVLYFLIYYLVEILLAPLLICLLTPLFVSCKARNDIFYFHLDQHYSSNAISQDFVRKKLRRFCIYCGDKINISMKICPKCGKSLTWE